MEKFLISEQYRLDIKWDRVIREKEGLARLEGCTLSGPVMGQVVGINHKDKIALDFGKQYRIFMGSYYVLTLEWEGFERRDNVFLLKNSIIRSRRLEFSPTLKDTDYIAVNTETHDTNNFKITKKEGFIPLNYKAFLIDKEGALYNFSK